MTDGASYVVAAPAQPTTFLGHFTAVLGDIALSTALVLGLALAPVLAVQAIIGSSERSSWTPLGGNDPAETQDCPALRPRGVISLGDQRCESGRLRRCSASHGSLAVPSGSAPGRVIPRPGVRHDQSGDAGADRGPRDMAK